MNDSVLTYEGQKFEKGSAAKVADPLTVEQALQIQINGKNFTVVMQTPGDEINLAQGLLFAEDVIDKNAKVNFKTACNEAGFIDTVDATIAENELREGYKSTRSLLSVSSCGICGKVHLEDIEHSGDSLSGKDTFSTEQVFDMQRQMVENQKIFQETGGCHGVAAFDKEGKLLSLKEDVGRHNALDKVVGQLIQDKQLDQAKAISFSGRISYEIVSKCFRARIPFIIAVSAPTSLAVDFAKEFGMTILGFTRDKKTTCYANPWRVTS